MLGAAPLAPEPARLRVELGDEGRRAAHAQHLAVVVRVVVVRVAAMAVVAVRVAAMAVVVSTWWWW